MKFSDPETHAYIVSVLIVQQGLSLMDDDLKWWCGCGDLVEIDDLIWLHHGKCVNCAPVDLFTE